MSDNSRIAKNAIFMYIRMAITMLVGLYTSRVVLRVLGVEDYGLYNVIGGIISMFTVLNAALVNTTSRFITVSLAKGHAQDTRQIFNMSFLLHLGVGIIIILLGETVGLWYLHNKMVLPEGREFAAEILYQFTVISAFLSTIIVPYNATIVAHEKINIYAIIQVIDVFLKLVIVIVLQFVAFDKLIFYAFLMFLVTVFNIVVNFIYCKRCFAEVRFLFFWSWSKFREILKFIGWALVGNFSHMFYTQGINLLLNAFCGPAVNAARGVAVTVQNIVAQFANNVQTAINPQILKSYAVKEMDRMYYLITASSRICFYLLLIISLPILLETDFLLTLWLGNVPDHTVNFVRIILMSVLIDAFVNPMFTANLASGKLAIYHGTLAVLMYAFMFVTYWAIRSTKIPESVFVCYLIACIIGYIMRIFIMNRQVGLKPREYLRLVLLPVFLVVAVSIIPPFLVHHFLYVGWIGFIVTSTVAVSSVTIAVYYLGITKGERKFALNFVRNKIQLMKKHNKE